VPTLHIHLDESGDWKFTPKSPSKYFILTLAWTYDPRPLATTLTSLRFALVKEGVPLESFHATEDRQPVRDRVVQSVMAHNGWSFAAVILEKCKINPVLYEPHEFYPKFAGSLLKFVLRGSHCRRGTDRVLVFADTLPMTHAKREGVLKAMKQTCASCLPATTDHHVFSYRRESNKWLQVADYCCWSMTRKWERGDLRTYNQLRGRLAASELVITDGGDGTKYY
jgi:hypothetical protein